ncbi:MAG: spore germination protein [Negativicutes bacterium]|nr:spore germination protein [Negativicutes bacterium]
MRKKQGWTCRKLSAGFAAAALPVTKERLAALRSLLADSSEMADELSRLASGLNNVAAPEGQPFLFTGSLPDNERLLRGTFQDCEDIRFRAFSAGGRQALLVYLFGMTDVTLLEKNVLETLMAPDSNQQLTITISALVERLVTSAAIEVCARTDQATTFIMSGSALLLIDGNAEGLIVGATKHVKRAVEESKVEGLARGPHDAFTETLSDNIVLLRRRSRDPQLKVRIVQLGIRSKTELAMVYVADLVKAGLVAEVERRLSRIKVDQVTLSATVEEWIIDHPWSPFPQTDTTEIPESLMAALYEGRIGLILDNTPVALIVPCTLTTLLQNIEDYTLQPVVVTLVRLTRYFCAIIGALLPAVYIAIVSYHPGMLPTTLAISVAEIRARTPYPAYMEVLIMEFIIEVFQEAVLRLPRKISGAASIVGGFVIGTTIVQSGLVNAMLVVATAGTAIASYTMPSYNLSLALRWLRVPLIFLASILGFYGIMLGYIAIMIHMCSLRSFGESYMGGLFDITLLEDMQDKLVRLPARWMTSRPKEFGSRDRTRAGD